MAEEGEVVELTRYDKPVAVIISYEDFEKNRDKKSPLLEKIAKLKEEYADVIDDQGFDIQPSRECPDYSKDPWA